MANYRLPQVNLSTRIGLAGVMLNPERSRGEVSRLAQAHQVSREFLYQLQAKAKTVLELGLEAHHPGPQMTSSQIRVDKEYLRQVITTLSVLPPSLRNLQMALEWLFGVRISLGNIQHILEQAGKQARAIAHKFRCAIASQKPSPPTPFLAASQRKGE